MNDIQTTAGFGSVPGDPAMAAADPAMFAPLTSAARQAAREPEAPEAGS